MKNNPIVGMKVEFPFQISICAWIDLLGYGSAIKKANYNPLDLEAHNAISRIRKFHEIVAEKSARTFPTLVMNDGACAYYDLSYRSRWPTYDFIQRAKALYDAIATQEAADSQPGARMVISPGFRLRGRAAKRSELRGQFVKKLVELHRTGKISASEAITRASNFSAPFDIVPRLQANFAFTKAYIAEQSGKSSGLPGPACYVDDLLIEQREMRNDDIQLGPKITWASEEYGLSGSFFKLISIRKAKQTERVHGAIQHHGPVGFRDALDVAKLLAGNENVLDALRQARIDKR